MDTYNPKNMCTQHEKLAFYLSFLEQTHGFFLFLYDIFSLLYLCLFQCVCYNSLSVLCLKAFIV